jgi:hypothetical protein|tara:strand:+ start:4645 stop:6051 length:1407 start_codon:yes stop_codon:yes gene_type:complete
MPRIWNINKWYGGLSTGSKVGTEGSFQAGTGLDFKTDPDILSSNLKMEKESGAVVVDFVKWMVNYDGDMWAYGDTGELYKRIANGTWSSERSVAASAGQGLAVFNNVLYYARNAFLGSRTTAPVYDDVAQALDADSDWHPMVTFLNKLCVGHARKIGTLDSTATWTDAAITIPVDLKIKSLAVWGDYLVIGAWKGTNITDNEEGYLFFWDGLSSTWNFDIKVNESGVNSMVNVGNRLIVFAGTKGNIYELSGSSLVKLKRIPGVGNSYVDIWPGASAVFRGEAHFGLGGLTGSSTLLQGVYSWGQVEKNYPFALNYAYPPDAGATSGTTLKIGAVYAISPTELFMSWDNNGTYGVDKINTATPQTTVTYESLIFDGGVPYQLKNFYTQKLNFKALPANTSIKLDYDADRSGSWTTIGTEATDNRKIARYAFPIKAYELQFRVTLTTTSGNSAPELISLATIYDLTGDI